MVQIRLKIEKIITIFSKSFGVVLRPDRHVLLEVDPDSNVTATIAPLILQNLTLKTVSEDNLSVFKMYRFSVLKKPLKLQV